MATNQFGGSTNGLAAIFSGTPNAGIGTTGGSKPAAKAPAAKSAPASAAAAVPTPTASTITTGGTGGGGGSSTDPNAVAYYNDVVNQLTAELNAAKGEQDTGINNINQGYNDQLNQLNQGESAAESSYNTQDAQNGQQREGNLNTIAQGARTAYDSLMSLLSGAGSGVSSAARYGAPQAVSLNASQQRSGADQTYNTNRTAIDTARKGTQQQYGNSIADLNSQKNSQVESFLSNLLGEEANLEQQIGAAKINAAEYGGKGYKAAEAGAGNETSNVNNIESQLSDIFKQYATPTFNVTPVTASTPNLTGYKYDPTSIGASQASPGTDQSIATYLPKQQAATSATAGLTTGAPISAGAS